MPDEIWQRQPGETSKSFAAFCTYRKLGPHQRSYQAVAETIPSSKSKTGHREPSVIKNWSAKFHWVARVTAFDAEMERLGLIEQEQEQKELYRRTFRMGADLFQKLAQRIEGDEEEGIDALDPGLFTPADFRTLGELAIKFVGMRDEKDKRENPNRPIEVRLAFDGTPRFPDGGDTVLPGSAPLELAPAPDDDEDLEPEFPEAA